MPPRQLRDPPTPRPWRRFHRARGRLVQLDSRPPATSGRTFGATFSDEFPQLSLDIFLGLADDERVESMLQRELGDLICREVGRDVKDTADDGRIATCFARGIVDPRIGLGHGLLLHVSERLHPAVGGLADQSEHPGLVRAEPDANRNALGAHRNRRQQGPDVVKTTLIGWSWAPIRLMPSASARTANSSGRMGRIESGGTK